jgi:hypothetical protein
MIESLVAVLRRAGVGLLLAAACAASACDEPLKDVTGSSPNLEPRFTSIRTEILETTALAGRTSCVTCHTNQGRTPAGNLNLHTDPYAALVNAPGRLRPGATFAIPGNTASSHLIRKLEGRNINGMRMPFNGPRYLTAGQTFVLRRWIENGPPNN